MQPLTSIAVVISTELNALMENLGSTNPRRHYSLLAHRNKHAYYYLAESDEPVRQLAIFLEDAPLTTAFLEGAVLVCSRAFNFYLTPII